MIDLGSICELIETGLFSGAHLIYDWGPGFSSSKTKAIRPTIKITSNRIIQAKLYLLQNDKITVLFVRQ